MRVPKRRSEQSVKRDHGPLLITKEGLLKLQKKLNRLQSKVPALIKEVEETKAFGDFSENAAYQYAKSALRRNYSVISGIENRIKRAVIIKKSKDNKVVQIGSIVTVKTSDKEVTYEILGSHESDPPKGRISNISPLGILLLDKKVGDKVVLKLPNSKSEYEILNIV